MMAVVKVIREIATADYRVSSTIQYHLVVVIIVHVDAIVVVIEGDAQVIRGGCPCRIRTIR